ncbi:MAG TPA: AAA family ATPase [Bryobacteraceae bacterium]|nr:AAA family ATPase [Bryobacteraceae bacterium]
MVIAGPNGVGKSTVLYGIKNGAGVLDPNDTQVLYQGPHRVLRRTTVQRRWLGGGMRWLLDLVSSGDVSGYEGLNFQNSQRTPDNVDEAGSAIKHTLGKIENRRQSILARVVDTRKAAGAQLDVAALPDIYEPIRTLTTHLLPHLSFGRIDFENEDNIRCLWKRSDRTAERELDIDDLSSGEKSIVILFLPLLEDQVRERLARLERMTTENQALTAPTRDRVILIDEPEQHLHPDLQSKILSYMRAVVREGRVQFVITTHSPTILDQAFDDELFALFAPSDNPAENQLRRIASNAERLDTLKLLTGSTYFLTTGRVVVCIEGETSTEPESATDVGLFEMMYPRATAFTFVPTKGKGNVINTVQGLRNHVPEETFRIRVRGLVDADQSGPAVAGVETLPVCMIENLLLDPEIIFEFLTGLDNTDFANVSAVQAELNAIAASLRDKEIELRVRRRTKSWTVRIGGASLAQVKEKHAAEIEQLANILPSDEQLQAALTEISAHVDQIITEGKALDLFRGKTILKEFYQRHIVSENLSFKAVCVALAKLIGQKKADAIAARLDPVFERLAQ